MRDVLSKSRHMTKHMEESNISMTELHKREDTPFPSAEEVYPHIYTAKRSMHSFIESPPLLHLHNDVVCYSATYHVF